MRILTIHGIRRQEKWYEKFAKLPLIKDKGISVLNFEYGYFTIPSFLNPIARKRATNEFIEFYNDKVYEDERPSAICHSFGSYILYKSMIKQKTIVIDKLILCGSILKKNIDWKILFDRGQINEIYHDYGLNDGIVILSTFIKECGIGGRIGFNIPLELKERITQEKNYFGHSDYFTEKHMSKMWAKFLLKHLPTFKFNKELITKDIIDRAYKCDINTCFSISKAVFNARIDKSRNYFAHYKYEGKITQDKIDYYPFKTSADSTEDAEKMNFIALNNNIRLKSEIQKNNKHFKIFNIYFDEQKNKNDLFFLQTRFQWLQTMSFNSDGDSDHWYIKGIDKVFIDLTFPYKLKNPFLVVFKNRTPISEHRPNLVKEKDNTFTYKWNYKNIDIGADALIFTYDGVIKEVPEDDLRIISTKIIDEVKYTMIYCQEKQIDYVYDLERKIEQEKAAHKTVLKQRRETFNEGFLIVIDQDHKVVSYLESIIWNQPSFEKFEEIKCFPLLHNIHGDELYIIFLATDPIFRKKGIGHWMLEEADKIGLKFGVKRITLVAKDDLSKWYGEKGFKHVRDLPNFLPNNKSKSIQMKKTIS